MQWSSRSRHHRTRPNSFYDHMPALLIFASQASYRCGYHGILASLTYFLQQRPYSWTPVNSTLATMLLITFSYITSPLGGWLADSCLGRCNVALLGNLLAFLSSLPLPFLYWRSWNGNDIQTKPCALCGYSWNGSFDAGAADNNRSNPLPSVYGSCGNPFFDEVCSQLIMTCVILLGLGTSFVWAVVAPLLSDQYPGASVDFRQKLFNWFCFVSSLACFAAVLILCYIQQNVSIFWGFMVPSISLFISLLLLLLSLPLDLTVFRPTGSPVSTILGVVAQATRVWCERMCYRKVTDTEKEGEDGEVENRRRESPDSGKMISLRNRTDDGNYFVSGISIRFLDYAKVRFNGTFKEEDVEGVRSVLRVMGVLLCLIPYWTSYSQMVTTFLLQGFYMDLDVRVTEIPAAWLSLFHVVSVLTMVPLLHYFIFPHLKRKGIPMSLWCQLAVGLALATLAMLVAGLVEFKRMNFYWGVGNQSPKHPWHRRSQKIGLGKPRWAKNESCSKACRR